MATQRFDYLLEEEEAEKGQQQRLVVGELRLAPPLQGVYDLQAGENTIGRGADNDIAVDHPGVSDRHAVLSVVDGFVFLNDAGSTNHSWVWDAALGAFQAKKGLTKVENGARLRFGLVEATVSVLPATGAATGAAAVAAEAGGAAAAATEEAGGNELPTTNQFGFSMPPPGPRPPPRPLRPRWPLPRPLPLLLLAPWRWPSPL